MHRVTVAAHGVPLGRRGEQRRLEPVRELGVGRRRRLRPSHEILPDPARRRRAVRRPGLDRHGEEEARRRAEVSRLSGRGTHLACGRHPPARQRGLQALPVPGDRGGHRGQAAGHPRPVLSRRRGRDVEDVAQHLDRAGDVVQLREVQAELVPFDDEAEPLPQRRGRHGVGRVEGHGRVQGRQRRARQPGGTVVAGGGEVREPVVVPGDPREGGEHRVLRRERLEVAVGDGVDGGPSARGGVGHRPRHSASPGRAAPPRPRRTRRPSPGRGRAGPGHADPAERRGGTAGRSARTPRARRRPP